MAFLTFRSECFPSSDHWQKLVWSSLFRAIALFCKEFASFAVCVEISASYVG